MAQYRELTPLIYSQVSDNNLNGVNRMRPLTFGLHCRAVRAPGHWEESGDTSRSH
jgi:hypothetical protein